MKSRLQFVTFACFAAVTSTALVAPPPATAQQNCYLVARSHTERYWDGQRWVTVRVPHSELYCPGDADSSGSGGGFPTGYGITVSTPDGGALDVHSGPGFNYPAVSTIANGTELPLTGNIQNNDWFETMDGRWVYKHHAR